MGVDTSSVGISAILGVRGGNERGEPRVYSEDSLERFTRCLVIRNDCDESESSDDVLDTACLSKVLSPEFLCCSALEVSSNV
jgi:hypothetical protein